MYTIEFSKTAEAKFYKLEREIQERIIAVLERIKVRPFYFARRVVGTQYYRLRVGDYRVILDIRQNESIIFVIELGHRKDIYE
jgi:mRNA interferase RelE/StbE